MNRAEGSGFAALLNDYRRYAGGRLWLAAALMLLGALAEGFGLLMIVPLASIAIGKDRATFARFAPWAAALSPGQRFAAALALFVGAMALRSVLLFARDIQTSRLQADYEASLRLRSAATLARRGWSFASGIGQAGMQSLLLNDVPRSALAVNYIEQGLIAAIMLAVQLTLTAILSPALTAVALVFLFVGGLGSVRWTQRGVRSGMAISEGSEESASSGFRLHAGLKAALAQGTVVAFLDEYQTSLSALADQFVRYARDYSAARQLALFGAAIAAAFLLFVGVRLLALPFPILIASLVLFARMSGPAQVLQQAAQNVAAYAPAFAAIERRLGPLEQMEMPKTQSGQLDWQELRLDRVRYEYRTGVGLADASISLKRGEWLGIGGRSGGGKTTLVDLIAGLIAPQDGAVTVEGRSIGDALNGWRAGLAYVGQDGSVFNDSVRGNLLAEGSRADDVELWGALEMAGLAERVRRFPNGPDESVGDRGSQLSGGERQRLVLARALLRRPGLLILDEATAALDAASEGEVLARIRALDPRPAVLLVAHRESSLAHCDSVIEIQHGIVKKVGD